MPEDVQRAMHYETRQLFPHRDAIASRILSRDVGADVDVADCRRASPFSSHSKGNDVSSALMLQVFAVQFADRRATNERNRDHRVLHALCRESSLDDLLHPRCGDAGLPHRRRYIGNDMARCHERLVTGVFRVCLDDLAHKAMSHDVGIVQVMEADAVDPGKNALDLHKP